MIVPLSSELFPPHQQPATNNQQPSSSLLKLTLILLSALVISVCLLQMRQQRIELGYQNQRLHRLIQSRQAELWNQQVQVAVFTSPNAIRSTVGLAEPRMSSMQNDQ